MTTYSLEMTEAFSCLGLFKQKDIGGNQPVTQCGEEDRRLLLQRTRPTEFCGRKFLGILKNLFRIVEHLELGYPALQTPVSQMLLFVVRAFPVELQGRTSLEYLHSPIFDPEVCRSAPLRATRRLPDHEAIPDDLAAIGSYSPLQR